MKLNKRQLVLLLNHFGYKKEVVLGKQNLFINHKKKSTVLFAPLRENAIVPELTLSGITNTIIYNHVATPKTFESYVESLLGEQQKKRRKASRKTGRKAAAKKKKR
jgi:hypothetical protein